jgi:transposase-like protein
MNKSKSNRFSPEVRERAVRMVLEQRGEYPSLWAVIESIAPKIGCVPQTLHEWVRRHEVDTGLRARRHQRGAGSHQGPGTRGQGSAQDQ